MDDLVRLGAHFLITVAVLALIALGIAFWLHNRERAQRLARNADAKPAAENSAQPPSE